MKMADETEIDHQLLPETGAADVGILAATSSNGASPDGFDDGIVKNQGDAATAAATNNGGIQKLDEDDDDEVDEKEDDEKKEEEDAAPTTRWDVFQALKQVTIPGNFCAGGCADGSTTITPSLPTTLGLRVTSSKSKSAAPPSSSIGPIPLPITDAHVQQLRTLSWKVDDESFHNVRQVDPECIKITNPTWDASLAKLLRTASLQLGVNPGHVRAELDMMMLFQRGSCIDRCCNADEDDNVVGTLMIQLPSVFTGGEIHVWDNNDKEENVDKNDENSNDDDGKDADNNEDESLVHMFDLGSGARSTAPFSCHYLSHYSDCDYEMKKIKSGTRLMLLYSLIYDGNDRKPNGLRRRLGMAPLQRSLEMLPRVDRILAIPLAKRYSSSSLLLEGIDALQVAHRGKVEAIRAAGKLGWKIMVVNATRVRTETKSSSYGRRRSRTIGSSATSSIREMFDENGEERATTIGENWLGESGVISFDSCEGSERGMMLAYKPDSKKRRYINSLWGKSKTSVEEQESDRYYGHYGSFDDECTVIHKKTYNSSFIIAYDESCEFELKCLRGKGGVIDNAVENVTSSKDFDLLERFASVLESRTEITLSHECSTKLVNLLVVADGSAIGRKQRIRLIRMFLERCHSGREPTTPFFESTRSAIESVGWASVCETVSSILGKVDRRGLSSCQFLVRVEFLHSLSTSNLVPQSTVNAMIENCFGNYKSSRMRRGDPVARVSIFLHKMIGRVGWTSLVQRATETYIVNALDSHRSSSYANVDETASLAALLLSLESAGGEPSMKNHLEILASDFASKLGEKLDNGIFKTPYYSRNCKRLAEVTRLVLEYGEDGSCNVFGEWITLEPYRFTDLLTSLTVGTSNEDLPLKVLNHIAVKQKSSGKDWIEHPTMGMDENSPPSSTRHIEQMLDKFPEIAQAVDTDGRISLHYAVASERTCSGTIKLLFDAHPKGASILDPVTGLYPFMLACASRNMDDAFKLLLADPSAVGGALAVEGKKRKRSPSMD